MNDEEVALLREQFQERWRAVAEIEAEEQRTASIELRWRQLNALYGLAIGLGLSLRDAEWERDEEQICARWVKLKEGYP